MTDAAAAEIEQCCQRIRDCALLDREPSLHAAELTLASLGSDVLVPLYLGSIVSGVVLGLAFSMLVDVFWRLHVLHNWRKRSRTRGAA